MAVTRMLASLGDLATKLRVTVAEDDPYALMMLRQASNAVRDEAHQPAWVRLENPETDVLTTGQVEAPQSAQDVTLWVAERAYSDPRNRSRRTSGPISESFFENGVYGLELKPDEIRRLAALRPSSASGLPWTLTVKHGPYATGAIAVPTEPNWGPHHIADEGDFPYAHPEGSPYLGEP